ncbi:rCG58713 [Rattus norvegicus]|uniref:RCG58713 n=1 Tax=Rattus norvegicus TaxID=10116 RepID=A6JLE3_RAT|nr:rCG58713 [Rattus norvegicus]
MRIRSPRAQYLGGVSLHCPLATRGTVGTEPSDSRVVPQVTKRIIEMRGKSVVCGR